MLILLLFYGMYLIVWRIYEDKEKVYKISMIITLIGIINVPIIKFSVESRLSNPLLYWHLKKPR